MRVQDNTPVFLVSARQRAVRLAPGAQVWYYEEQDALEDLPIEDRTPVDVYAAPEGGSPMTQPVVTDSLGCTNVYAESQSLWRYMESADDAVALPYGQALELPYATPVGEIGSVYADTNAQAAFSAMTAVTGMQFTFTLARAQSVRLRAQIAVLASAALVATCKVFEDKTVDVEICRDAQNAPGIGYLTLRPLSKPIALAAGAHTFYMTLEGSANVTPIVGGTFPAVLFATPV